MWYSGSSYGWEEVLAHSRENGKGAVKKWYPGGRLLQEFSAACLPKLQRRQVRTLSGRYVCAYPKRKFVLNDGTGEELLPEIE